MDVLTRAVAYYNSYVDTNVMYYNNKEFLVSPGLTCGGYPQQMYKHKIMCKMPL